MSSYTGSKWRKCDLHVHTPFTKLNNQYKVNDGENEWEVYCQKVEESDVEIFGITDYFSVDNYFIFLHMFKDNYPQSKKVFFPNIEFRLDSKNSSSKHIQIHVLFSNLQTTLDKINNFLTRLDLFSTDDSTQTNKYCINNDLNSIGYDKAMIKLDSLESKLKENFNNDEYLIIGVANGYGSLRPERNDGRGAEYAKELDKKCHLFFGTSNNTDFYLNKIAGRDTLNLPPKGIFSGSDSHSFEHLDSRLGKNYENDSETAWVKVDATFEGIRQIIYEPESRLCISENKPQTPLHKIRQVTYKFDENTQWDNDKFCLTNLKDPISFSPSLTCIIGGRGSGKSTLLNAIAEKIGKGNNFFSKLSNKDVSSKVIFEPEFVENIEYLAQNTIEEFATNDTKFTEAIFDRLNKSSSNELKELEDEILNDLQIFDDRVLLFQRREQLHMSYIEAKKELKKYQSIIDAFADEAFIKNKKKLQALQKNKILIEASRKKYESLFIKIQEINNSFQEIDEPKNKYDIYFNSLYEEIEKIFVAYKNKDYSSDKEALEKLSNDIKNSQEEIETFLREKGLNDENIKDAQTASGDIEATSFKIDALKNDILNIRKDKIKFTETEIDSKIPIFKRQIETELSSTNAKFLEIATQNPQDVKNIKITYSLSNDVFDVVFNEFSNKVNITSQISSFRKTFMEYLQYVSLATVLEFKNSKEFISGIPTRNSKAHSFLTEVFSNKTNFLIYQTIIKKHLHDVKNNKILTVHYDNKTLVNSSFGQRCTAAIVILISLGNTPIIIDEPEAHLDSSLIANYLVNLLKDKKQHRQIIFATHNANFVLNADAELIIKLTNSDGDTTATYFSIENLTYREELLKLEGGKEAFKKREQKYNI